MKRTVVLAAILAGVVTLIQPAPAAKADVAVSFSFFHDSLAPHGRWVTVGSYGRCWYPVGVPVGWQPYTVGYWGWGDFGWTWMSGDPWGDWTYRYGTWTFQPPWGWVWVPGYVWAPAWVTWSYTNNYIGWAPIPPSFSFSVGGYFGSPVVVNRSWYCFVPRTRFVTSNVYNVRVPVDQNRVILAGSHKVTRFPVSDGVVRNEGPALRNVERAAAARVQRVSARQMRAAPARIEPARTTGKRISVSSPAATRREPKARVEKSPSRRSRVERSRPQTEVRREKAVRPPNSGPKRERAPAPDARRAQESRPAAARERQVSRPSGPEARRKAPSAPKVERPARPSKPRPEARASRETSSREKSRAVRASERTKPNRDVGKPSKNRSRPDSKKKPHGRG